MVATWATTSTSSVARIWLARILVTSNPVAQPPTNTSELVNSPRAWTAISRIARLGLSALAIIAASPPGAFWPALVPPGRCAVRQRERAARTVSGRPRLRGEAVHIGEAALDHV